MTLVANLPRVQALAGYKLAVLSVANIASGLPAPTSGHVNGIVTGGAVCTAATSATSATCLVASISSISAETVNLVVTKLTYSGPTIALDATTTDKVNLWVVGW